jgi:hypothetical protein
LKKIEELEKELEEFKEIQRIHFFLLATAFFIIFATLSKVFNLPELFIVYVNLLGLVAIVYGILLLIRWFRKI